MSDDAQPVLWLIDQDEDSLAYLEKSLLGIGDVDVRSIAPATSLNDALNLCLPMACVINHYANNTSTLDKMSLLALASPSTTIIVLAAPGLAHQQIQAWQRQMKSAPIIVDKPLRPDYLCQLVSELTATWRMQNTMHKRIAHLSLTQPSSRWLEKTADMKPGEAVMAEMTVLITDIRHSTQRIVAQSPQHYLSELNHWLGLQTRSVYAFEGSVIKYTGDGLLAIFEGGARQVMAMKCAQKIISDQVNTELGTGIGIADGLVMGGLLGSDLHYQFDVIGQAVHLAARLCARADSWQAVVSAPCLDRVEVGALFERQLKILNLRGFAEDVAVYMINEK